jgi:cystathionine beta-lyase/cystathionine gamma-synthase
MSAMFASIACMVSAGDHVVASASMFSSCMLYSLKFCQSGVSQQSL